MIASKATLVESGIFPDIQKVETLIFEILCLNLSILNNLCRNSFLQDQEAELLLPADPARVFHPVWRPQNILP